jgi:hypothetical protein
MDAPAKMDEIVQELKEAKMKLIKIDGKLEEINTLGEIRSHSFNTLT